MSTFLLLAFIKTVVLLGGLMTAAAYFVLLERRVAAWVQDRHGPNRVGVPLTKIRLFGLGQPLADGLKMIFKEEYTPGHVNKILYTLAPIVTLATALAIFAIIPFGSALPAMPVWGIEEPISLVVAPGVDVGAIYVFALSSVAVYGVILGGWSSNSKFSFLGALRSSAQLISYELPLGLGLLGVVLATGSLRLDTIITQQASEGWFVLLQPLGFVVFVTAAFAEAARMPFDLPEAEQELVAGYHTEFAGMKLLMYLIVEFLHMTTAAFLIVILFLGGWHFPFLTGGDATEVTWFQAIARLLVLHTKIFLVVFFFMMVRWSWPRFRFDQLMTLAWKVMLPLGMVNFVAVAALEFVRATQPQWLGGWLGGLEPLALIFYGWVVAIAAWLITAALSPILTDNRPQLDLREFDIDPQV